MYTQLRGSTYHFRFNVPRQYRHLFGWSIYRSLCSDPVISTTVAEALGHNLRYIMKKTLDDNTIKGLVDQYIKETLESIDRYINTREAVSRDMAEGRIEVLTTLQGEKEEALIRCDYKGAKDIVDRLLQGQDVDRESLNRLSRALLNAGIKLDEIQIAGLQGEHVPTTLELEQATIQAAIPATVEPVDPGPPLSEFMEKFGEVKTNWDASAKAGYKTATNIMLKILGDIPVGTITTATMVDYRETLVKAPTYWTVRHDEVTVEDLPVPGLDTMSKGSIDKHMSFVRQLMDYAMDRNHLKEYPMPRSRMILPDDKIDVQAFSDDQVKTIFKASRAYKDEKYWIPRLGYYTGCRLNELCQLHKADLRKVDGIWCLDINNEDKKTIKNKGTKRLVPLHPVLIEMGFVKYAQGVKHHRIFPGCKYREKTKKYRNGFSKWFSRTCLVKTNIKESNDRSITFHSFRHRVYTVLKRQGVEHEHVDQIVGHAMSQSQNDTYNHGYELPALKADIDLIPDHRTL